MNFQKLARCFYLTFGLIFFVVIKLFSQSNDILTPPINIPTSPEAALLGRFGDIPISYYSGTANISIPLYTIKKGSLEIPIILNYNSTGVKVEDEATWVGLGWDLSPGGLISQEVRGKNDESDYPNQCEGVEGEEIFKQRFQVFEEFGFLNQIGRQTGSNNPECGEEYFSLYNNYIGDPYCCVDKVQRGYGQPDIYHYNFGKYSGQFYIVPETQEIRLIDRKEQIYFEKINENCINATTIDGTRFQFGAVETASGGNDLEYTGKVYKVNKIILLTGDSIMFEYSDHSYTKDQKNEMAFLHSFEGNPGIQNSFVYTNHYIKTLTRIITTDEIIDFILEDREDILSNNMKRLHAIDITSSISNKKIKSFEFGYDYFPYSTTGVPYNSYVYQNLDKFGKRLKLVSLRQVGYDAFGVADNSYPPYNFEYEVNETLPLKCSYSKDFWGYYNGVNNTNLLPNLEYFDFPYVHEYQVTEPNSTTVYPYDYPYVGADRFTDNSKVGAYMLKKIMYPTGGYTEFEFEPNSFTNQFIPDRSLNIHKNFFIEDNSLVYTNSIKTFSLSKSTTVHFENRINNGKGQPGITPLTRDEMIGCYIRFSKSKIVNGVIQEEVLKVWDLSTVTNYDFENDGGKFWLNEKIRVNYDPDPTTTYQAMVFFPDSLNDPINYALGVSSRINYYDDTDVDTTISKQCGLRIKTIKNFSEDGVLASHKKLIYSGGKLLNKFRPLKMYRASKSDFAVITGGICYESIAFFKRISVSSNDFGTSGGTLIGYSQVEEVNLIDSINTWGKKIYYYINNENKTFQDCPNIPDLRNGLISKEETFTNNNIKLASKIYIYDFIVPFPKYTCKSIMLLSIGSRIPCGNYYTPIWPQYHATHYDNQGAEYNASKFGYNVYTINGQWGHLSTLISEDYFENGSISITENYTYNNEGSIKSKSIPDSKGVIHSTVFYYPQDHVINPLIDNYMISVHNTGTPVLIEEYNGEVLLSGKKTVWGNTSLASVKLPREIYRINTDQSEEMRISIDSYNVRGLVTQFTQDNNLIKCYGYGYDNSLLVNEVTNSSREECSYTGFEIEELDGWEFSPSNSTADFEHSDQFVLSGNTSLKLANNIKLFKVFHIIPYNAEPNDICMLHSGYKASVWVKGATDAYLKIYIQYNSEIYSKVYNPTGTDEWHLLEVQIPQSSYRSLMDWEMSIVVEIGSSGTAYFDNLRFYPMDAQMTTYDYEPLVGVSSICNFDNKPTYYEYDNFGRLVLVRDFKKNILKKYDYHFRVQ